VLPQPLVRVRLTVLATAPAAAAEARRTDWKRMISYLRLKRRRTRWRFFRQVSNAPGVEVLYTRTECLLELDYTALGHSVDPIGQASSSRHLHALALRVDQVSGTCCIVQIGRAARLLGAVGL
jgi:hypothetical protein